ncbi:hypothetical protein L9F63_022775, partial [Diploptera punctata]
RLKIQRVWCLQVTILRSQLETLRTDLDKQRLTKEQELKEQAAKFTEKLKNLEKDLEKKSTLLEFKTLEAGNAEERCRLLESQSKMKLVEPQVPHVADKFPD